MMFIVVSMVVSLSKQVMRRPESRREDSTFEVGIASVLWMFWICCGVDFSPFYYYNR